MSDLPDWKTISSDARDLLLRRYVKDGLSARLITEQFQGCSRSAVIGRIHRLKLKLTGGNKTGPAAKPKKASTAKSAKAPAPAKPKPRQSARVAETASSRGNSNPHRYDIKGRAEQRASSPGLAEHLITGEAKRPIEVTPPEPRMVSLLKLGSRSCKWPVGDPQSPNFGFCGHDTVLSSYCTYHSKLAYMPMSERQRSGLRSAERIR